MGHPWSTRKDENKGCWHQLLPAASWTVPRVCWVCVCVSLITDWVLRCHSREAQGGQHTSLTDYANDWVCTNMGTNMEGNVPVTVCYRCATSAVLLVTLCYVC